MADQKYEIDDQGNLVDSGNETADGAERTDGRPVTPADRRRFLLFLLVSDVIGIAFLFGGGLLLPESRTVLLILGAAYAVAAVPIYVWMSRLTQRKVEADSERHLSS